MAGSFALDPVQLHARLRPDGLACIDLATNRRWTYQELDSDVQRATTVLAAHAVRAGDRVATLAANNVHQIILLQALMRLCAIHVPLNWRLARPELAKVLADCEPSIVLTDMLDPSQVEGEGEDDLLLPPGCRHIGFASFCAAVDTAEPGPLLQARPAQEACVLLYTSGTSGAPKGVVLTAASMMAATLSFGIITEADTGCVFLCDGPMFHFMGLVIHVWSPLTRGGTVIVSPRFSAEATNSRLADQELAVTHYFCVPQMTEALARAPNFDPAAWTTLKALFTGGAPNPPARTRWWLDRGVLIVNGYGSTEAGTVSGMPVCPELIRSKAGSVGPPAPLTSIRVVDAAGLPVPVGEPGEILVSGPSVTPGYWNNPEEDAAAFTEDGWFRTGDIGRVDEDGFIFLIDRRKHMFISGGENVYPAEVEAALAEHPEVLEAAVVGVPDERWGEAGRAFVVAAPGSRLTHRELIGHCQALIARYKIPKETVLVSDLPKTGSGKIQKHLLVEDSMARL
ncbi:AMP-binding enzyme [Colletotrichum musicola]|uniref:AMP-binding enzyme n=1 Tax=Colletotrichum musicola TaxID=2175873 RepID=A0A8H6JDE3_9PEZI|nr:AMP-binding enzyme [Colletotrichum musicola]